MKHEPIHSKTWLLYISCCLMLLQHWETLLLLNGHLKNVSLSSNITLNILLYCTGMTLKNEFCKWSLMKSYWFPYMWGSILCCDMKSWNFFSNRFIPSEEHMSIHLTVQPFKEEIRCCSLKQKKKKNLLCYL